MLNWRSVSLLQVHIRREDTSRSRTHPGFATNPNDNANPAPEPHSTNTKLPCTLQNQSRSVLKGIHTHPPMHPGSATNPNPTLPSPTQHYEITRCLALLKGYKRTQPYSVAATNREPLHQPRPNPK